MKLSIRLLLGSLLMPAIGQAQGTASSLASRPPGIGAPLVLRGVTVIDVSDGQRMSDQTVVVSGRRIQAITSASEVRVPRGAYLVDARGKYLIPGLWDMHVHPKTYVDIAYPLFIANGVTGVRDAGSDVPLATFAQWKREIATGARVGPRLLVSGPSVNGEDSNQHVIRQGDDSNFDSHHIYVPPALARRVVDSLKAAGADFIKTYSMSRAMYFVVAAEARRVGIQFGGHLPTDVDGREASDSGATFVDHYTSLHGNPCRDSEPGSDAIDVAECAAAARQFRRNGTWITSFGGFYGLRPSAKARVRRYLPAWFRGVPAAADTHAAVRDPNSTAEWAKVARSVTSVQNGFSALRKGGLPVVVGTDAAFIPIGIYRFITPGFSVPEALMTFVLAGLTPLEALQTATLNPALALHATDSLGTVEAGKLADLLLLDADPLADIWNLTKIRAVVANGRYYDRAALDQLLADAERAARRHDHGPAAIP